MNWNKIKEKYPKAYTFFREDIFDNYQIISDTIAPNKFHYLKNSLEIGEALIPSLLFRFFDEQGIIISIEFTEKQWFYFINDKGDYSVNCKTRTEAEEQAFMKAFELLEGKCTAQ